MCVCVCVCACERLCACVRACLRACVNDISIIMRRGFMRTFSVSPLFKTLKIIQNNVFFVFYCLVIIMLIKYTCSSFFMNLFHGYPPFYPLKKA